MAKKSKAALMVQVSEFDKVGDQIKVLVEREAVNISEEFRDQFRSFLDDLPDVSMEFLAYWETNPECKAAMSTVLNYMADEMEKMTSFFRDLAS